MEGKHTKLKVATFRERFDELCESNPQNASRIADDLHVSRQTVSAWRSGYRSPKEPTIIAIAKHFGVTVGWLMGFDVEKVDKYSAFTGKVTRSGYYSLKEQPPVPKTVEARCLAKGIDKMPPEQREEILKMMMKLYPGTFEEGMDEDDT